MNKYAFTLAEILLTLAIIGLVAALTIPAVVIKVVQDQYVVALKKAYNSLKTVEREAIQEHGEIKNWDWNTDVKTDFEKYFLPYFDVLKNCGDGSDDGCFYGEGGYKYLNGDPWPFNVNTSDYYTFVASDGLAFAFFASYKPYPDAIGRFHVDVNGKKGPNIWGRDMFAFDIFPNEFGLKPIGIYESTGTEKVTESDFNTNCISSGKGTYCAVKVLSEGAMNY